MTVSRFGLRASGQTSLGRVGCSPCSVGYGCTGFRPAPLRSSVRVRRFSHAPTGSSRLIERILPRAIICRLHSKIIVVFQIPRPAVLLCQRLRLHDGMTARHALCKFADVLHRGPNLHVVIIEIFDHLGTLVPICRSSAQRRRPAPGTAHCTAGQ